MLNLSVKQEYNDSIAFHTSSQNLEFMSKKSDSNLVWDYNYVSLAP